ncbi:MAG: tetratricopeptide repeat protein [Limisphaerales bacterium]
MLATKKGVQAVHISFLICSALFLFAGCAEPGPKALLQGERLIKEQKYSDAISYLQDAVELLPQNPQAWNHLGLAYHYSGQPSKAVEKYERALQINRNLAAARYNLGQLYFEQNNYNAAASQFTTYVTLEPKNGEAWNKLATAQFRFAGQLVGPERNKWLDAAKRNFEIALQFRQDPHLYNSLGMIEVQRGRPRDSVRYFNLALQKQPNYAPAVLNLAVVHHAHLNDRRTALQRYREFLSYQPRSSNLREIEAAARQIELELNPPQFIPNTTAQAQPTPQSSFAVAPPTASPAPAPAPVQTPPAVAQAPAVAPANTFSQTQQPRPDPRTNQVVAKPAPTAPARTESATAAKPETTVAAPAPKPAPAQAAPAAAPALAPAPAPVQVAKLPEEPPIKAAVDAPREQAAPIVAQTPVPAPSAAQAQPSAPPTQATEPAEDEARQKAGFVKKLNPTSWFRDKTNAPAKPEPATTTQTAKAQTPVVTATNVARQVTALPARPEYPRYRYLTPTAPRAGNRAEAARIFNEGLSAQRQGDTTRAMEQYRRATQLDPAFFEAHYNLGLVALDRNSVNEALVAYENALAISPDAANARYNFAFALQRGNYMVDAANEFEKLLARHPRETRAHLSLANLYAQQLANREKARMHYQKVLELEPQHPQAMSIRYWIRDNP